MRRSGGRKTYVPLDDVQRLAVEIARAVEPSLVVEAREVDDGNVYGSLTGGMALRKYTKK